MNLTPSSLFWALSFGTLPALIWLVFWLREDKTHPEPKRIIVLCFILGGASVFVSIACEKLTLPFLHTYPTAMVIVWASIEEFFKYLAAYIGGFKQRWYNEPMDAIVYLLTAALGFAAVENTLYLLNSLNHSTVIQSILIGNFRFVGASLLHFVSSVALGLFIAFAFFKRPYVRNLYLICGLLLAIALHTVFNLLIIGNVIKHTTLAFLSVWIVIVITIALFERIKKLSPLSQEIT